MVFSKLTKISFKPDLWREVIRRVGRGVRPHVLVRDVNNQRVAVTVFGRFASAVRLDDLPDVGRYENFGGSVVKVPNNLSDDANFDGVLASTSIASGEKPTLDGGTVGVLSQGFSLADSLAVASHNTGWVVYIGVRRESKDSGIVSDLLVVVPPTDTPSWVVVTIPAVVHNRSLPVGWKFP